MAKILYISPEHVSGTLSLFQKGHRARGHECRYVTFYPSSYNFPEDICLHLPLMPDSGLIRWFKERIYHQSQEMLAQKDRSGYPPTWRPNTAAEAVFFYLRDMFLSRRIETVIRQFHFDQFDLIHLDQGLDFYRDARFARRLKKRGAYVTCFYHGTDLRNRGVIPAVDEISDLNLTSELDLLNKHPNLHYLYLPFEVERFSPKTQEHSPLVIGHACRSVQARHFKGTERIIAVVKELESRFPVKLDLAEGLAHEECLQRKAHWDIAIDQISDVGGWGYGVNSLETLALGIPTCTRMNAECEKFFHNHPFINVDEHSLAEQLIQLIQNPDYRRRKGEEGRQWVVKHHALENVMAQLYDLYHRAGINL